MKMETGYRLALALAEWALWEMDRWGADPLNVSLEADGTVCVYLDGADFARVSGPFDVTESDAGRSFLHGGVCFRSTETAGQDLPF